MTQYGNWIKVDRKSKLPKAMKKATKNMLKSMRKAKIDPSKIISMEVQIKDYEEFDRWVAYWKVKVSE